MMDSLAACLKRFEDAKMSIDDETAEWNKIKTVAVTHRDKRLELSVDYYIAHNKRYKERLPAEELIKIYQNIMDRAEKISFFEMVLNCKHTQARLHLELKNYETSFTICKQLEKQLANIDSKTYSHISSDIIYIYNAIADIYYQFQEFELAVQVLKKAIDTPCTAHNFRRHFNARNTLGLCYSYLNQPDSAMFYFQSIIDEPRFAEMHRVEIYKIVALKNIADIYFANGEYEKTITMYKEVFKSLEEDVFEYDFANGAAIGLAQSYLYTGNIKEAKILLDDRLKREHIGDRRLRDWFETVSIYYQKTGNYKMALAYSDSTRRLEQKEYETVNTMRLLRVEQAANALDMKMANAEKKKTRNYLIFALIGCIILAIALGIWIYLHRQIARKNRSLYLQIQELLQKEKAAEQQLFAAPEEELSRTMQLFRSLSELMQKEKLFTDPDLNRKMLSDRLGTNETYLADAIREATGETFSNYVSDLRLQYTLQLMSEQSDLTSDAVAIDSGHGSYSTFFRLFTKKYGITPSEYRKMAKKKM
jgi:AraC-like DNA-binding protein